MAAYNHGIKGLENANFIADMDRYFWAASSFSNNTSGAWVVNLGNGNLPIFGKVDTGVAVVVCVRGG